MQGQHRHDQIGVDRDLYGWYRRLRETSIRTCRPHFHGVSAEYEYLIRTPSYEYVLLWSIVLDSTLACLLGPQLLADIDWLIALRSEAADVVKPPKPPIKHHRLRI